MGGRERGGKQGGELGLARRGGEIITKITVGPLTLKQEVGKWGTKTWGRKGLRPLIWPGGEGEGVAAGSDEKECWTDGINEYWLSEDDVVRMIFGEFVNPWEEIPEGRTGSVMGIKLWDDVYREIIVLD